MALIRDFRDLNGNIEITISMNRVVFSSARFSLTPALSPRRRRIVGRWFETADDYFGFTEF
jgi:hypothetical protein